MNTTLFLQIFLLFNVFLMGGLAIIAAQHAIAHFKPQPQEPEKPHRAAAHAVHLPPEVRKHLLEASQAKFQTVLDRSADELRHNLNSTAAQLNKHLEKLGNEIVSDDMKRYRENLNQLRNQAAAKIESAQAEIAEHQAMLKDKLDKRQIELEAKLNEEIAAEKQQLVQQIDTKLADAVVSFLTETLQHNIDLGAQGTYLTTMLEEHKTEIAKGIVDET